MNLPSSIKKNSQSWSTVEEIGVEYSTEPSANRLMLHAPVCAACAPDGSYLIVDELCAKKPIPFRMEYRTLRVDASGEVLFDTECLGIQDGYGCLFDGNSIAVLRRTQWKLIMFSPHREVVNEIDLTRIGKFLPRVVTWTQQGTFLITFLDRSKRLDIVEIDVQGRLLWRLPSTVDFLGVPASVQLTSHDSILVADAFWHVVWEFDRHGNIKWQFGRAREPANTLDRVSGPTCVRELPDGRRLITDTRNHRLLIVNLDETCNTIGPPSSQLSDPAYADVCANGNLLICDTGNRRILEMDVQQRTVREFGRRLRKARHFCFPRSVKVNSLGDYVIADTANDRIVKCCGGSSLAEIHCAEAGLFWPRCVRPTPSGTFIIADGRRGRIIEMGQDGSIIHQLSQVSLDGPRKLEDPHDVHLLSNGHLLVTDSPQDFVVEVDWEGNVYRAAGIDGSFKLDDPHGAQQLDDGRWTICDTGNHRVLLVDSDGQCVAKIDSIVAEGAFLYKLNSPKYVEACDDGLLIIVDTGNNRVLAVTIEGELEWIIDEIPDSPITGLDQPRWATMITPNEILVSDHFHHRVIHLRRNHSS